MTVEQSIRKRERESNLADAVSGLDAELEELQSTLATALAEYEALLDESLGGLPSWADVDQEEVRELFCVSISEQRVLIGPRAAAVVAGRLESFIGVWISEAGVDGRPESFDEAAAATWAVELNGLAELVALVADGGRTAAREAEDRLSAKLDELIAKIAEDRETAEAVDPKLEELRRKLRKGKVGAALLTRESEADSLEEQRRKAEALKSAWAPLEQLAVAGAELGADASERLRAVLQGAVEAVVAGYPELYDVASDWVKARPDADPKPAAPPPLPVPERDRIDHVSDEAVEEISDVPDDGGSDAVDDGPGADIVEPEVETEEEGDELPAPPRVRVDTDAPRMAQDTPLAPASATATMEVIASQRQFREPIFRLTKSWSPVQRSEIALALGAPTLYVVGITAATLAYQFGVWSENPFEVWPSALPMFFAFAVWAIGMPAFSGWRVEWVGRWPRPVRLNDHREGGFVEIGEKGVSLPGTSFAFVEAAPQLTRWREGRARGWMLTLDSAEHGEVRVASEADSARWDDSKAPCADSEPTGAWRSSEEALLHIADECQAMTSTSSLETSRISAVSSLRRSSSS